MIGPMADIDFSLLDVPRSEPVGDPEAYLRAAIAWHFGEETGSAFWLRAARTLPFNPLTDVTTFADLRAVPQSAQRVANRARRRPDSARIRITGAGAADLRIRRHHGCTEKDCAAAGLGCAGGAVADRGLRRRRLRAGPWLSLHDAERAARSGLLLASGLRATRLDLSRHRPGPALGEEAGRPQRRRRDDGLRRPPRRAGGPRAADPAHRESAHHSAAARGHRP